MRELKRFLEIKTTRDRENRKIWLCQDFYINKIVIKFHLKEMKCSKILFANLLRINKIAENSKSQRIYVFQQRMKLLNFAAIIFRLEIIFATAKLIQFLKKWNSNHFAIANQIIVYLNDIRNLIIEFSKNFSEIFLCANDVVFADNELIKKSLDVVFSSCMMIRLINVQSSKSRWRRSASRQNYWFWVESRKRQFDENDFSSSFDTTR